MPTLTKDGVRVTTEVPRELVTLRSQGFKEEPATEDTLNGFTVKELRKELTARQLPVKGSKDELVARLAEQPVPPVASDTDAASTSAESPSTTTDTAPAADSVDQ